MSLLIVLASFMSFLVESDGSHFLGGIITFRPTGNGKEIIGNIRTGWNSDRKYCDAISINSGTVQTIDNVACLGCDSTGDITISLSGVCTGFSTPAMWTSFRSTFSVTPVNNEISLRFSGAAWVHFGGWSIVTEVDLSVRTDNGKINNSPTVETAPIIYVQHGCHHRIMLSVWDEDGDIIRCRFSSNPNAKGHDECGSLCMSYPNATFENDGCTLSYFANEYVGYYGVAIQVEDFPNNIATKPLSSVGVQYLINVYNASSICSSVPKFVTPTPIHGHCFINGNGETFSFVITAYSASSTNMSINTISPLGAPRGQEVHKTNQTGTYVSLNVSWVPTDTDLNQAHHVCFEAVDLNGLHSEQRCVLMIVLVKEQEVGKNCVNPNKTGLTPEEHCSTPNAVCTEVENTTQFICRCKPTYYDDNGERTDGGICEPKQILGKSCVNPNKTGLKPEEHCSTPNAVCTEVENTTQYICRCKPTYYDDNGESTDGGTCVLEQILGKNCVNPNKTGLSPEKHCFTPNAVCTEVENTTQYICRCKPNYYDDNGERTDGGICEPEQELGKSCVNPNKTGLTPEEHCSDPNAVCTREDNATQYSCRCKGTHYDDNGEHSVGGTCQQKRVLGASCQSLSAINNELIHPCLDIFSECVSGNNGSENICRCTTGFYDDNGEHVSGGNCIEKVGLEEICPDLLSKTETCLDLNSVCSLEKETGFHKCACESGFYQEDEKPGHKTCVKKHDLGVQCKGDYQCSTWQSVCKFDKDNVSRCMCQNGYTFENSSNTCEGNGITYCPAESYQQISWENTPLNTSAYKSCPDGYTGFVKRYCDKSGEFHTPSFNCSLEVFNDVLKQSANNSINTSDTLNSLAESLPVPERLYSGDINTIETILDIVVMDNQSSNFLAKEDINNFINITNELLDPKHSDGWAGKISETDKGAETFLKVVDAFLGKLAATLEDDITIKKPNMDLKVKKIEESDSNIVFPDVDDAVKKQRISSSFSLNINANTGNKFDTLAVVVYKNISDIISTRSGDSTDDSENEKTSINSEVMAINIFPKPTQELNPPLELSFQMFEGVGKKNETKCSFWDPSLRNGFGSWSTKGCVKIFGNETTVKCQCKHLTNFAILVSPSRPPPVQTAVLSVLSMVGCAITMTFLLLTIIANSFYWRQIKSDSNMIPMVLCVCLFIGNCIFVFGINRTESKAGCTFVAVLLHYTFLLIFFLMLAEGLYITIRVVFIFHVQSHIKGLLIAAFVVPVIIVGITASVTGLEGYGDDQYCWFAHGNNIFWAFAAPAIIIVMVNMVILGIVLYKMYGTSWIQNMDFQQKTKTMAQKLAFLVPLLGLTWAFGFLSAVSEDLFALQILFLLCNLLQGPVFFVFHCLLNKQLKAAIEASIKRIQSLSDTSSTEKSHEKGDTFSSTSNTGTTQLDKSIVSKDVNDASCVPEGKENVQPIVREKSIDDHLPSKESLGNVDIRRSVLKNLQSELKIRLNNVFANVATRASALISKRSRSTEDEISLQIDIPEETPGCSKELRLEIGENIENDTKITCLKENNISKSLKMVRFDDEVAENTDDGLEINNAGLPEETYKVAEHTDDGLEIDNAGLTKELEKIAENTDDGLEIDNAGLPKELDKVAENTDNSLEIANAGLPEETDKVAEKTDDGLEIGIDKLTEKTDVICNYVSKSLTNAEGKLENSS